MLMTQHKHINKHDTSSSSSMALSSSATCGTTLSSTCVSTTFSASNDGFSSAIGDDAVRANMDERCGVRCYNRIENFQQKKNHVNLESIVLHVVRYRLSIVE